MKFQAYGMCVDKDANLDDTPIRDRQLAPRRDTVEEALADLREFIRKGARHPEGYQFVSRNPLSIRVITDLN